MPAVTDFEADRNRYRALFQRMEQGYCALELIRDADGRAIDQRYLEFNPAFERTFGIPIDDAAGRLASEVFPGLEPWWTERFDEIAKVGTSERIEHCFAALSRWFEVFVYPDGGDRLTVTYDDVTDRHLAAEAMRQGEARQRFLLRFSDALRAEPDADAVACRALSLLSEELGADRAYVVDYRVDENRADVTHQVGNDRVPPMPAMFVLSDYPDAFQTVLDSTFIVNDEFDRRGLSQAERVASGKLAMRSMLASTVRRGEGNPLWSLAVLCAEPRHWQRHEISLVEEAAERTWAAMDRAQRDDQLRESEARFRQFAEASAAGLWIRQADTLEMEFASPAVTRIYGLEPNALLGDVELWASRIVPDDRQAALMHLEKARHGLSTVHEFRIQRQSDHAFRWIRNTDFPLSGNGHVARIGGIAEDVTEAKQLAEHRAVLLAELQHRVRNIMAMIRSTANRTAPGAADIESYRELLEGRLLALARVQVLLTREANAGASLQDIVVAEVGAQAHHDSQLVLSGPTIALSPKAVEVLTLALHELATNALKYGALSVPEGRVVVTWAPIERRGQPWLSLDWKESGGPPTAPSSRKGFGSELVEARLPYELHGTGRLTMESDGARCRLEFPLQSAESILETDAPQPTAIFGGALDMTGAPDLTGRTVLVVEDDYYIATDTAAALRGAGAEVLGPCQSEEATRSLLDEQTPTHAVLDLNLGGGGPRFEIAHILRERGIPFVFLTGYDPDVIPADLADTVRLQKPLPFRSIVEAVSHI